MNKLLKKYIDKSKVVSFDIFDTLIKRNCMSPSDIFSIVEKIYNKRNGDSIKNFCSKRREAEKNARNKYSKNEDITLEQIYECIDYEQLKKKKIMEIEIETELKFCQRNYNMDEIYEYCKENGKKIICVSDMYLSRKVISEILEKAGYNIEYLFVSADINKTKLSGNLFRHVINEMGIDKSEIVHIGDSWKADFIAPLKLGIKAYHIKKNVNSCKYLKVNQELDLTNNIMYSFINNNSLKVENEYERIGYEIVGPLSILFCYWINGVAINNNLDNLLFCARDMKMIQAIYNMFFKDKINNSYFYVSRKSTYLPYLYIKNDYDSFKEFIPIGRRKISVNELLNLYNITYQEKELRELLSKYDLNFEEKYDLELLKCDSRFENFYNNEVKEYIKIYGEQQYNNFNKYLKSIKFSERTAIIDLGWRGTTQNIMIDILNQNIFGMYFGLHSLNGENLRDNFDTYLFYGKEKEYSKKIYSFMSLFELLISALHGSTISYNADIKNPYNLNESANKDNEYIKSIQNGAIKIAKGLLEYFEYIEDTNNFFFADSFIKIGINPTLNQVKILGDIYTENLATRKLCNPKKIIYYFFHIKQLKEDLIDSEWKIGFMKRLFRIKLPYYKIYNILKN